MKTPLYNTDIIPLTSRPTLTVMDDGDYFVILDTSTGKISKILKTNIMTALKITYDNITSGLTAETVQSALDELVVNLGSSDSAILALSGRLDTLEGTGEGSVAKAIDDAVSPIEEDIADHEGRITQNESEIGTILVGQDLDPNKDVEVLGARVSPVTGTHGTIGDRMTEAEKIMRFQSQADYVQLLQSLRKPDKTEWVKNNESLGIINYFGDDLIVDAFNLNELDGFIKWFRTGLNGGSTGLILQEGNIDTRTGTWNTSIINSYTTQVGATFTNVLKGNYFLFRHYADNRGGVWKFEIDDVEIIQYSTWRESSATDMVFVFGSESIDHDVEHTIVATFMGDDPLNAPSGGTSRGWVRHNPNGFEKVISSIVYKEDAIDILKNASNRDFAFEINYGGGNAMIPYHGTVSLAQIDNPKFIIDGTEYLQYNLPEFIREEFSTILIEQHFYGVIDSTNVAEFWHKTTIESGVISFAIKMKILEPCQIYVGYAPMLPAKNNSLETIISSIGNRMDNLKNNSKTYFTEEIDYGSSYVAIDSTNKSLALAVSIDYPMKSNRIGSDKVGVWALNSADSMLGYLKLYDQIFNLNDVPADFEWAGYYRFASVVMEDVYELFS